MPTSEYLFLLHSNYTTDATIRQEFESCSGIRRVRRHTDRLKDPAMKVHTLKILNLYGFKCLG